MKLKVGLVIGKRYRFIRQIAQGGMGEVWFARDILMSRDVAIKAIREEHAGNTDFLKRLRNEARNNAGLEHKNIVEVYDYYESDQIGFIIMEYIEGKVLSALLSEKIVLEPVFLCSLLSQMCSALDYAHSKGIVHRDIKPSNIMIKPDGTVKIVDFGVSKATDQGTITATGMVVGSAHYLSPEQAIGDKASGQSDLYAVGIIAYEASAGKRPFNGKNQVDIAIAQVNAPVPKLPEHIDAQFRKLVMKLLEKDLKKRPNDLAEVAREFTDIANRLDNSNLSKSKRQQKSHRSLISSTKPTGKKVHKSTLADSKAATKKPVGTKSYPNSNVNQNTPTHNLPRTDSLPKPVSTKKIKDIKKSISKSTLLSNAKKPHLHQKEDFKTDKKKNVNTRSRKTCTHRKSRQEKAKLWVLAGFGVVGIGLLIFLMVSQYFLEQ